jgi:hypothetical protein
MNAILANRCEILYKLRFHIRNGDLHQLHTQGIDIRYVDISRTDPHRCLYSPQ